MSCLHSWQADEGIIAHCGQSFQCHVAGSLDSPFVVLLKQDGTYEAYDGGLVGEYSDHVCPAFDLAVEAFQWIGAVQLRPAQHRSPRPARSHSFRPHYDRGSGQSVLLPKDQIAFL